MMIKQPIKPCKTCGDDYAEAILEYAMRILNPNDPERSFRSGPPPVFFKCGNGHDLEYEWVEVGGEG